MNVQKKDRRYSLIIAVALSTVFCLTLTTLQSYEIRSIRERNTTTINNDLTETESTRKRLSVLKKSPSLGFRNMLANGTFLSFLQYFSDATANESIDQNLSPNFFEAIITLDPFYRDYYLFLSGSTTFYAALPERSVEIMSSGLEKINPSLMSDSFYIWRYKAVDELLFLNDSASAQESFENAATWAHQSNRPDSDMVGEASRKTADFLAQNPESHLAQIAAWNSVLANAVSDDIRERATQRIQELKEDIDVENR